MTYGELSRVKTEGFATNPVIDDVVNNARWAFRKKVWQNQTVSEHELRQIGDWSVRECIQLHMPVGS